MTNFNRKTIKDDKAFLRQRSLPVDAHELDHLDEILHMDVAKQVLEMTPDERKTFRLKHPYRIISKTCKY